MGEEALCAQRSVQQQPDAVNGPEDWRGQKGYCKIAEAHEQVHTRDSPCWLSI